MDLIADTTFLVGLWRKQPWALAFTAKNHARVVGIPWVVRGEFLHGALRAGHDLAEVGRFLSLGIPLDDPVPVLPYYAKVCAELQEDQPSAYREIGQNDLWIAAISLQNNLPLVTRNRRHFTEIAGMRLAQV